MDVGSAWKSALAMTAEHTKCSTGNEVVTSDKVDLTGTLAFVGYGTVKRKAWRSRREGNLELKVDR